jgi:O-antigen ligase
VLTTLVAGYVAYTQVPIVAQRLDQTLQATQGSYEKVNAASSSRLTLWKGALRVMHHHPVNGAGVRAFRYAYPMYAPAGDPLLYKNDAGEVTGEIYAHQILLEVASETGLIGIVALIIFYFLLVRRPWRRSDGGWGDDWPYWLGAAAWLFPLSAHTAFYSSYWSHLLWWLLALAVASGWRRQDTGADSSHKPIQAVA